MKRLNAKKFCTLSVAAAFVLSGCGAIPSDGEVGTINNVADNNEGAQTRVEADGPSPGESPDAIVRGFLEAGAAYSNNYAVARSYLTDGIASDWDPQAGVNILSTTASLDSITSEITSDSQSISMDIPVQGTVDAQGVYQGETAESSVTYEFSLRQVNGEWRISQAPDGILVTASTFENLYENYPLYFYTPDFEYLVPDMRWFLRSSATGTQVMSALLRGPVESLTGAVVSPIPGGTALNPQAVTINDGRANIGLDLSGIEGTTARNIYHQIRATMLEIGSVSSVEVATRDATLTDASDAGTVVPISGEAVAIMGTKLAFVNGNGNGISALENSPDVSGASNPAVNYDGSRIAYLNQDRTAIYQVEEATGRSQAVIQGDGLVGPSYDRYGWLWTAETRGRGIMGLSPDGELATIPLAFIEDKDTLVIAVSPDGSRIGVLSRSAQGQTRIDVGGMIRDDKGMPVRASDTAPLSVGMQFEQIRDFAWAGTDELAVLARPQGQADFQPYAQYVTGPSRPLGDISGGRSIAAGNDIRTVRVDTDSGDLYTYSSGAWQRVVDSDITDPAYSG